MFVDLRKYLISNPELQNRVIGADFLSVEYRCPINVEQFRFWNDMHVINYVISGRKDWIVDGKVHALSAGQAAFIRKGVYSTKQYFDVEHCVLVFMMNDAFIRQFLNDYPNLQLPPASGQGFQNYFEIDVDESIQSVLFSVSNYLREGERVAKELVEIKFKELLLNLVLNQKNQALGAYFNAVRNERQDLEYTMRKNFLHDLSTEQFARLCGKSLSAFKRDFTEHFGSSPGKWLTEMRLNHAKGLLLTTSLSVNEVCYDSGFKNPSHSSRAFKQQFGVAPQSLRDKAA